MAFYIDTSAAAKLVVGEAASKAMASWAFAHEAQPVASDLLRSDALHLAAAHYGVAVIAPV